MVSSVFFFLATGWADNPGTFCCWSLRGADGSSEWPKVGLQVFPAMAVSKALLEWRMIADNLSHKNQGVLIVALVDKFPKLQVFMLAVYITFCLSYIPAGITHYLVKAARGKTGKRKVKMLQDFVYFVHCRYSRRISLSLPTSHVQFVLENARSVCVGCRSFAWKYAQLAFKGTNQRCSSASGQGNMLIWQRLYRRDDDWCLMFHDWCHWSLLLLPLLPRHCHVTVCHVFCGEALSGASHFSYWLSNMIYVHRLRCNANL